MRLDALTACSLTVHPAAIGTGEIKSARKGTGHPTSYADGSALVSPLTCTPLRTQIYGTNFFQYYKGKKTKELFNFKLFITTNNQELGNRFHSLTAKTYIDTFNNFFFSLFLLLFYVLFKIKSKIPNFDASLYLYDFYGTTYAVKIKELLRNFSTTN